MPPVRRKTDGTRHEHPSQHRQTGEAAENDGTIVTQIVESVATDAQAGCSERFLQSGMRILTLRSFLSAKRDSVQRLHRHMTVFQQQLHGLRAEKHLGAGVGHGDGCALLRPRQRTSLRSGGEQR